MEWSSAVRFVPALAATLLMALVAPRSEAGGLDISKVPAEATWVAHIDVARLWQGVLGDALLEGGVVHANVLAPFGEDLAHCDRVEEAVAAPLHLLHASLSLGHTATPQVSYDLCKAFYFRGLP